MSRENTDKKDIPRIHTLKDLKYHLQLALEVEFFTIPPYLCALWSIQDGNNLEAQEVIKSVVIEEMLHMTLVANLMNAVGAKPKLGKKEFPTYPNLLPHSSNNHREIHLEKFSPDAIEAFMEIEQPRKPKGPPEDDNFQTIGQFYEAVLDGLEYLVDKLGSKKVFKGHKNNQITPKYYYGSGGFIFTIENLKDARNAIHEISEQGEGYIPESKETNGHKDANPKKYQLGRIWDGDDHYGQSPEPAHYYRFQEIILGQKYQHGDKPYDPKKPNSGPTGEKFTVHWDKVDNMQKDPQVCPDYQEDVREKMDSFNQSYTRMMKTIEKAYNGHPHLLREGVGEMYKLKYLGKELMRIPSGDGKTTVGPSFKFML